MHDQCIFLSWLRQDDFCTREINIYGQRTCSLVKNILMDLFIINMQLFDSQDVHWLTGVVWIIVMFLSAVWTSGGTHSLQRIHQWASDAMLNFSKSLQMKKQTHLHLEWVEEKYIFSKFSLLGELFLDVLSYSESLMQLMPSGDDNMPLKTQL